MKTEPIPIVRQAERTEREIVNEAKQAQENYHWTIGKCAAEWCELYGEGKTDSDFASLIGSTQQVVNKARRVYSEFYALRRKLKLSFTHYREALTFGDLAEDCLRWASLNKASVAKMQEYHAELTAPAPTTEQNESTEEYENVDDLDQETPEEPLKTPQETLKKSGAEKLSPAKVVDTFYKAHFPPLVRGLDAAAEACGTKGPNYEIANEALNTFSQAVKRIREGKA